MRSRKQQQKISTHSLTRRLTKEQNIFAKLYQNFNSQPHKEADIYYNIVYLSIYYFNSQPHKEADN